MRRFGDRPYESLPATRIGTAVQPPDERNRPEIGDIVTEWTGPV